MVESSAVRVPSAVSRRSRSGSSRSIKFVSTANHLCQNQVVSPPLIEGGKDVNQDVSSTTRQRILDSGSALNKLNVIWVRPAESDVYTDEGRNLMNKLKTQYRINNLKDICFILWEKDERLVHNKGYKVGLPNALWHQRGILETFVYAIGRGT